MANERPPEQPLQHSIDESVAIDVQMKSGTPDMTGWNVEFVLFDKDANQTPLITKISPVDVTIDTIAKVVSTVVLRTELAGVVQRGREYNYKFRRTNVGAEKRLAEGPWRVKSW